MSIFVILIRVELLSLFELRVMNVGTDSRDGICGKLNLLLSFDKSCQSSIQILLLNYDQLLCWKRTEIRLFILITDHYYTVISLRRYLMMTHTLLQILSLWVHERHNSVELRRKLLIDILSIMEMKTFLSFFKNSSLH